MKKLWMWIGLGLVCIGLAGCASSSADKIYQASTIDALLAGVYDGDMPLREVRKHGDLGLGTLQHLDGELILLDGQFYQVKVDGRVYSPPLDTLTPFAAVCRFRPEQRFAILQGDMARVESLIDRQAPNQNQFLAIRIDGHFRTMRTRSVPAQRRPYPPLKDVTAQQAVFDMQNVSGTVLGFRSPPYVGGVNVPGYHLHFISEDRSRGGHILGFDMVTGVVELDRLNRFEMKLPDTADFATVDLTPDRGQELQGVEKDPHPMQ